MSRLQISASPGDTKILIDGVDVSRGYWIDYVELAKSGIADGGYFFLTCGCGEAGCAGLFKPIEVSSDEKRLYWHIVQPEPERWFTFTKSEYRGELKKMITHIFSLSKRASSQLGCVFGFNRESLKDLESLL
jgi:hypothetical protein